MCFRKMNIFRFTAYPEYFPDLRFSGKYPSDEKFRGVEPKIIFGSACNAFNFVCLSQLQQEVSDEMGR